MSKETGMHGLTPWADAAERWGAAPALLGGASATYAGLLAQAVARGNQLRAAGLQPGDVLALAAPRSHETVVAMLGAMACGATVLPMNPGFPEPYRDEILARAGCTKHWSLETGLVELAPGKRAIPPAEAVLLVLTSGSTSHPKAAALSLANFRSAAAQSQRNLPLGPGDAWLLSLPLYHVSGLGVLFRAALAGAAVALPQPGQSLLDSIAMPGVTHVSLVPTQVHRLMREPGGVAALRNLKAILCGGGAMPRGMLEDAARERLPLCISYGMTETTGQIAASRMGAAISPERPTVYPLCEGTVRLTDAGEIAVKGAALFLGYWSAAGLEVPVDDAGWFLTGDLGTMDPDGALRVCGRLGNRFKVGGENVQPEEIERALLQLPGVAQARVTPVDDAAYGQRPVAFVDGGPEEAAALAALAGELPKHALPVRLLPWPHALESALGKLNAAALRAHAQEVIGRKE